MKIDLTGRVAVIVGSGGMLDKALVDSFVDSGAKVALCVRPEQRPEADAYGEGVQVFELKLEEFDSIEGKVQEIIAACGKIDILVNNPLADLAKTDRVPMHEIKLDEFVSLTDRWFKGMMRFAKYCTQDMTKRKSGAIVNFFSVRALVPVADQTTTIAVSAGIQGMTRMWGVEMRDWNIRSNGIGVGVLEDEPELPCGDAIRFSHANIKRPCKVQEAADAAVFLASDAASYITGTMLSVDGGLGAGYARSF